jgi:hypothetical protein
MNNKGNKSNTRHRILDYIKNSDAVRSVDIDAVYSALYTVISTKTKLNYPLTNILLMQHPDLRPIMITIY